MKSDLLVTIFDGSQEGRVVRLSEFNKDYISFGRSADNAIIMQSRLISKHHGAFECSEKGWLVKDCGSKNGIYVNGKQTPYAYLYPGLSIRVDDPENPAAEGVCFIVSAAAEGNNWRSIELRDYSKITIGRSKTCTINLPHVSVSRVHATITRQADGYYIQDSSTNGTSVNGRLVRDKQKLREKDVILITNTRMFFSAGRLSWLHAARGIGVDAIDVVKTVKDGKGGTKNIANHISLSIQPGEFVAIIGGSGAGKSTFMNCISGYSRATGGRIIVNGEPLYENYEVLKSIIGYVPQQDIVYDDLSLFDMLDYAAKLRMPSDTSEDERKKRCAEVISMVELSGHEKTLIRQLSGGQKKRASIAVELLADPNLFFLDEPTSGLDPGTERNLMHTLRKMADDGRTVILVTHNTMNLHLCDKLIILGRGGNLCFCGSPDGAKTFFGIEDYVDMYPKLDNEAVEWRKRYYGSRFYTPPKAYSGAVPMEIDESKTTGPGKWRQLKILCARYFHLIRNDKKRLLLLISQAVLLAILIKVVADPDETFNQFERTKAVMFAMACAGFWIGMLNAIQEICKERTILRREYAASLSMGSYVLSKFIVLGAFCFVQSLLLVGVFTLLIGGIDCEGLIFGPFADIFITIYLTTLSAMAMGLWVSSLCSNSDRAMTVAPILLMPQILFSGLAFELKGATETISYIITCRWGVEGLGSIADLNSLERKIESGDGGMSLRDMGGFEEFFEDDSMFTAGSDHLLMVWGILLASVVLFAIIATISTKRSLEKSH